VPYPCSGHRQPLLEDRVWFPTTLVQHPSSGRLLPLLMPEDGIPTRIPLATMSLEAVLEPLVMNLPEVAAVPDTIAQNGDGRAPLADTTLMEETGARVAEEAEERGVRVLHEAITEDIGVRAAAEANPTVSIGDRTRLTL